MPFLDFLKKIFGEEQAKEAEKPISLENLPNKIQQETEKIRGEKEEINKVTKKKVEEFISQIKERINLLENISIDKRKEQEKIKLIVKENLKLYLEYLRNLIHNLEKAEQENYIKQINNNLQFFNRVSYPAFEKSTLLIGDELGKTRGLARFFAKEINNLYGNNEKLIEKNNKINDISKNFNKIEETKNTQKAIEKNVENLNSRKEERRKKKEKLGKEILELKDSQEYQQVLKENEKIKQEIEQELLEIRQKIDFKELAKIYHTIEKENRLIQNYNKNFRQALEQDNNLEIIELAKTANLDISKLASIKIKLDELKTSKPAEIEIIIRNSEDEIKNLDNENLEITSEIAEKNKKIARLKEKISLLEKENLNKAEEILTTNIE